MLNTIIGAAAALVLAAKQETSFMNIYSEPFMVQKTGIVKIYENEEDVFYGLACRDNGLTAIYISSDGWLEANVKAKVENEDVNWQFQPTGGTIGID